MLILTNIENYQTTILLQEVAKIHKKLFGKGPNRVGVAFRSNMVTVKAEGVLTRLEKNLLKTDNGERAVTEIRETLFKKYKPFIIRDINEALGLRLSELNAELFVAYDELILVFC